MGYAALMVHAEPDEAAEARIRLADRFDAALIGLAGCSTAPPAVGAPVFGPAVTLEVLDAERKCVEAGLRAAHKRFRAAAEERDGRRTGWRAFLADLLVVGRGRGRPWREARWRLDPGDALMRAGRPVLVVPPGVSALEGRRVLVAWKDTREARARRRRRPAVAGPRGGGARRRGGPGRALRRAEGVTAQLAPRSATAPWGEALGLHGRAVADELLLAADRHGADLVLAGAYGHARPREWALGGVTRDLLERCPVCCLLSQ